MIIGNDKQTENRTVVINNKKYYENDLNDTLRNSLIALGTQRNNKVRLAVDLNNCDILINHHDKIVNEELAKIKSID
jgi:hypothetical protein